MVSTLPSLLCCFGGKDKDSICIGIYAKDTVFEKTALICVGE